MGLKCERLESPNVFMGGLPWAEFQVLANQHNTMAATSCERVSM
jgi:hypothetical protein